MNLGEWIQGDRIRASPYMLEFQTDVYCAQLGMVNVGRNEMQTTSRTTVNHMARAIHLDYHHNWILDGLPSASKSEDDVYMTTVFTQGFPIGLDYEFSYRNSQTPAYIHNHVNIEVYYSRDETDKDGYNIVQFIVEPFSIPHKFKQYTNEQGESKIRMTDSIASCQNNNNNPEQQQDDADQQEHTSYDMIVSKYSTSYSSSGQWFFQKAAGNVLFTYDVIWREIKSDYYNKDLTWSTRWDAYLSTKNKAAKRFRWISLTCKSIMLLALIMALVLLVKPNWRACCCRYLCCCFGCSLCRRCCACCWERDGYKEICQYVFTPPVHSPTTLAALCGTGAQVVVSTAIVLLMATLGLANPSMRGWFTMIRIVTFPLCGGVAGYVAAHLHKAFLRAGADNNDQHQQEYQTTMVTTAFAFPSLCAGIFFLLQLCAWSQNSTLVVPFWVTVTLAAGWLGLSPYMVFQGARLGYKQDLKLLAIDETLAPSNGMMREIPKQPCYAWPIWTIPVAGMIPYGSNIVELRMLLNSLWEEHVYYVYGFLSMVAILGLMVTAITAVFFTHSQLSRENYRWWWRSFLHGGAPGGWMMFYCTTYFRTLRTNDTAVHLYFFAFSFLFCLSFFLALGSVGLLASLFYNLRLYARIKMERGEYELLDAAESNVIEPIPAGYTIENAERGKPESIPKDDKVVPKVTIMAI
eukprot:scaffold336_cov196-Amphora_coffeaeformis.AAC.28